MTCMNVPCEWPVPLSEHSCVNYKTARPRMLKRNDCDLLLVPGEAIRYVQGQPSASLLNVGIQGKKRSSAPVVTNKHENALRQDKLSQSLSTLVRNTRGEERNA